MHEHRYAPYYCEENVWWLAQEPRFAGLRSEAVIVSNDQRSVAVSCQRASVAGEPVVWDYHVVLAVHGAQGVEVWDLDCTRGAPLAASAWIDASFDERAPFRFAPRFRLVAKDSFVATFASDRRHMRRPDGSWQAPPPPWPIIGDGAHELERFVDVRDTTWGAVMDLAGVRAHWR